MAVYIVKDGDMEEFGFDYYCDDNGTCDDYYYQHTQNSTCDPAPTQAFASVYIPVVYSLVFVVGLVGHGLLLVLLHRAKKALSVTDTFILHLGVADVLLMMTLPIWTAQADKHGWQYGTPLCKITGSVFMINFYCGMFLLACISVDRYMAIVHSTTMFTTKKPWHVHVSCLGSWIVAVCLSIPDWMYLEALGDDRTAITHCVLNYGNIRDLKLAKRLIFHLLGFALPAATMCFCYISIMLRLRSGPQPLGPVSGHKRKALTVVVMLVAAFLLCWTPYNIIIIVETMYIALNPDACESSAIVNAKLVATTIGFVHCCLNPLLYAFTGHKFREPLLSIMPCLRGRRVSPRPWSRTDSTVDA